MSNKHGLVLDTQMMAKPHTLIYKLECDFDTVVDTITSGLVYSDVAQDYGVTENVVIHFARKYKLNKLTNTKYRKREKKRKLNKHKPLYKLQKNKSKVIQMLKADYSYEYIAEILDVCTNSLHYFCKKYDIQKAQLLGAKRNNRVTPHTGKKCICCGKEFVPGKPTKDNITLTRLCLNCYTNSGNMSGMDVFDECQVGLPRV